MRGCGAVRGPVELAGWLRWFACGQALLRTDDSQAEVGQEPAALKTDEAARMRIDIDAVDETYRRAGEAQQLVWGISVELTGRGRRLRRR